MIENGADGINIQTWWQPAACMPEVQFTGLGLSSQPCSSIVDVDTKETEEVVGRKCSRSASLRPIEVVSWAASNRG